MKNSEISLIKASMKDCQLIHKMQVESFKVLLDKYQDYDTNPAVEPLERIESRMSLDILDHYLICLSDEKIGSLRVRTDNDTFRLGTIFILPEYQGKGYAKQSILKVEQLYPEVKKWGLATIKQESKLCHFYESLGYRLTSKEEQIQDDMTIVFYEKELSKK